MNENHQDYRIEMAIYTPTQGQWIPSDCNSILFLNKGTANVTINNVMLLLPDDFLAIDGNEGEIDRTQYQYAFSGIGTNILAVVFKKFI